MFLHRWYGFWCDVILYCFFGYIRSRPDLIYWELASSDKLSYMQRTAHHFWCCLGRSIPSNKMRKAYGSKANETAERASERKRTGRECIRMRRIRTASVAKLRLEIKEKERWLSCNGRPSLFLISKSKHLRFSRWAVIFRLIFDWVWIRWCRIHRNPAAHRGRQ